MGFPFSPACRWQRNRLLLRLFILPLVISTVVSCGGGGGDSSPAGPSAPTNVTATPGDGEASIGWKNVTGATSYNIYYSTTTGVPKETATKIDNVTSPNIVAGLNNGTTYFFVVTAVNAAGESADSSHVSATPVLAPPVAPTGVTATAGHGEATIHWDNVAGATSFNIYYSTTTGVNTVTATRFTNVSNPYIAIGMVNGTTYYFVVTAVNAAGEGPASSEVSATPTPAPPPAAPTGVTATADFGEATIGWLPVTGATSYNIYHSTTTGVTKTTGTKVAGVTSPKVVTGLTGGTTYYFIVTAVNADGESLESTQVSATTFLEYVAFGDSITLGQGDNITDDDTSRDGRNTGGGFEPILNNLLTSAKNIPHSIVTEGYGGYTSSHGLGVLPTVLAYHPKATYFLILFGTNDAYPLDPTPSGAGLSPGQAGYTGSYKDYMQSIISAIRTAGKIPYLAKVPYTLDPARNANILEYNQVIGELVVFNGISITPPDFYGWFEAHPTQLVDPLHPNGDGYQSMATLWLKALVPPP